jgi:hypothetical protein
MVNDPDSGKESKDTTCVMILMQLFENSAVPPPTFVRNFGKREGGREEGGEFFSKGFQSKSAFSNSFYSVT